MLRKKFKYSYLIALFPIAVILSYVASFSPNMVEHVYSKVIYRLVAQVLSSITGIVPFSIAELIIIATVIVVVISVVYRIREIRNNPKDWWQIVSKQLGILVIAISLVYFSFVTIWGLNYHRNSIASIVNLDVHATTVGELELLNRYLIERANLLRDMVEEDSNGVMFAPNGRMDMLKRADLGFQAAAELYPELRGRFGRPKPALFSKLLSYQGIGGVYFPFTAEANVNIARPHFLIPFTALHEMAHQRGIAREDEANYIGYVTAIMHPDYDFQYSGTVMALNYSMAALRKHDRDKFNMLKEEYSPGLIRDFSVWTEHSLQYQGPVSRVSNRINNAYLQANAQADGVQSYGRMVDLMIAHYREDLLEAIYFESASK